MPGARDSKLDGRDLDLLVQLMFLKGLAESTQKAYASGQRCFFKFCLSAGLRAVPASEEVLCKFAAKMACEGLQHRTIKSYMAGVRHLHIEDGMGDPFVSPLPRLHYVMREVKRHQGEAGKSGRERLPITPDILRKIKSVWDQQSLDPDIVMLWAACCLAFFGFLRAGELTMPGDKTFDASTHLVWDDVAVDDPANPGVMSIRIKVSKTDPFRMGISLFIGKVHSDLCPVAAMMAYLVSRGSVPGPLFVFKDGRFLTRPRFVSAVRQALQSAGVDCLKYAGHSFRIGAATTAASRGMEDSIIKTLGR